jgi:hypothetical protein
MRYDGLWDRLLEALDQVATVRSVGDSSIELEVPNRDGAPRHVEIKMSPLQWDHMVTIPWGGFDAAAQHVQDLVRGLHGEEAYLIYSDYDLVASTVATLEGCDDP